MSLLLVGSLTACSACSDRNPVAPPDTGSPLIEVRFPNAAAFDRDSNGLVDLELAFADSLSGVDAASIRLTSSRPVKGPAGAGANLLEHWQVVRADSTGLVVEETVDNLLPRGPVTLTVAVEDLRGNEARREIALDLPPAARHTIIDLQAQINFSTNQVTIGPDGSKAYVTTEEFGGSALSIVDVETFELVKVVRSPIDALARTVLDSGRNRLYLVSLDEPRVAVFDLASDAFLTPIEISSRGVGAVMSLRRDKLYIGLQVAGPSSVGFISVVDLAQGVEESVIDLGIESETIVGLGMSQLLLSPDEERLFTPTSVLSGQQGVLIIDPDLGRLLEQIDLWPEVPEMLGGANDLDLDQDRLIATSVTQPGLGRVVVIPLANPDALRFGRIGQFLVPNQLAVSPQGLDWAVTAGDFGAGFMSILLMDPITLQVLWEDRIPSTAVAPQGLVFRPDGNVFFVTGSRVEDRQGSPSELTVYLHR